MTATDRRQLFSFPSIVENVVPNVLKCNQLRRMRNQFDRSDSL